MLRKSTQVVTITPAVTEGTVRLQRETAIDDSFHKFTAGALFSAKSVDENFAQIRHSQQEVRDGFEYLEFNTTGIVSAAKDATVRANAAADVVTGLTTTVNGRVAAVEASQASTIQRVDDFIATDVAPIVNDAISKMGFVTIDSFELGATITQRNQALRYVDNTLYRWAGDLPKVVPSNSTPESTGGFSDTAWLEVSATTLRQELSNPNGATKVGSAAVNIDNVAAMKTATWLEVGMIVSTSSYYSSERVGGNTYAIEAKTTQVIDDGAYIDLANNLVAKGLFPNGAVELTQFGAKYAQDVSPHIVRMMDFLRQENIRRRFVGKLEGIYTFTAPLRLDAGYTTTSFNLDLHSINDSEVGVEFDAREAISSGKMTVICGPSGENLDNYLARRQQIGVKIFNAKSAELGKISVQGAQHTGVLITSRIPDTVTGNSNMMSMTSIFTLACGSSPFLFKATPSVVVNSGSDTSYQQRGTLTFASVVPASLRVSDFILVNDKPYIIDSIDTARTGIVVFPQLPTDALSEVTFLIGAGVHTENIDSNVIGIDLIDTNAGCVGVKFAAFYGPDVGRVHVGNGAIGIAVMSNAGSYENNNLGGHIGYLYTEGLPIDVLQCTGTAYNWKISSYYETLKSRVISDNMPRLIDTQRKALDDSPAFRGLKLTGSANRRPAASYTVADLGIVYGQDYLLLTRKMLEGNNLSADLYLGEDSASYGGYQHVQARVTISQAKGPDSEATLEVIGSQKVTLCTLQHNGDTWFALDMTKFLGGTERTNIAGLGVDDVKFATAAQVSAVVPHVYLDKQLKTIGDLDIALDGKSIKMKSPNNTVYKLTVSDAGVLTVVAI